MSIRKTRFALVHIVCINGLEVVRNRADTVARGRRVQRAAQSRLRFFQAAPANEKGVSMMWILQQLA